MFVLSEEKETVEKKQTYKQPTESDTNRKMLSAANVPKMHEMCKKSAPHATVTDGAVRQW
jgi:hypothetical protein